jgi:hypothetical protein
MRSLVMAAGAAVLLLSGVATSDAASRHEQRVPGRHDVSYHQRHHARPWYFGRSQDWAAAPRAYTRHRADFDGWKTDVGIR